MAVVVQSQLAPDLSFVLHTAHPLSRDPATLAAELAPGLGETLAAGACAPLHSLSAARPLEPQPCTQLGPTSCAPCCDLLCCPARQRLVAGG